MPEFLSIADHAQKAFENVYSLPFPDRKLVEGKIARIQHGIQHVSRTALYIPVLANLYRRFEHPQSSNLTDQEIYMLQITALYHDSARRSDGVDMWDEESGEILFNYLQLSMDIDELEAKKFADAIAKKDLPVSEKNIYQKLIHDADCLDIMRAREVFDANYLDFYKDIASKNEQTFHEMACLIMEVRSLIYFQGDLYKHKNTEVKEYFEHTEGYYRLLSSVFDMAVNPYSINYKVIRKFYNNGKLLAEKELQEALTPATTITPETPLAEKIKYLMEQGQVFSRSIVHPSALHVKKNQTMAEVEIRKTLRRKGQPTLSGKTDKHGNLRRSLSLLGWNASAYWASGFLICGELTNNVETISHLNFGTGRNKKKIGLESRVLLDKTTVQNELQALLRQNKMGGVTKRLKHHPSIINNEIVYDVDNYDAIYFSYAPNQFGYHSKAAGHLEAIFLQNEYQKATQRILPIFAYDKNHHEIFLVPNLTHAEIKQLWIDAAKNYLKNNFLKSNPFKSRPSISELKILCTSPDLEVPSKYKSVIKSLSPADSNYSVEFQNEITEALQTCIINEKTEQLENIISGNYKLSLAELYAIIFDYPEFLKEPPLHSLLVQTIQRMMVDKEIFENLFDQLCAHLNVMKNTSAYVEGLYLSTMNEEGLMSKHAIYYSDYNKMIFNNSYALAIYYLAKELKMVAEINTIKKQVQEFLKNELADEEKNINDGKQHELNYEAVSAMAILFDVYKEFRLPLLKMFYHYGLYLIEDGATLLNLLTTNFKDKFSLEEVFYYKEIANFYGVPENMQTTHLACLDFYFQIHYKSLQTYIEERMQKKHTEIAIADGNCAFNAFALALSHPKVLNNPNLKKLDSDNEFLRSASHKLELPEPWSWEGLKNHLISLNTRPFRRELQLLLSPLLRKLAIDYIINNPDELNNHLLNTQPALLVEFEHYIAQRRIKDKDRLNTAMIGDIFISHKFIKNKFEDLYLSEATESLDLAPTQLLNWWSTEGHLEFLKQMTQSALHSDQHNLYAGDLELAALGACFGLSILVSSSDRNINYKIYNANPKICNLSESDKKALVGLNIIENNSQWRDLSLTELQARLSQIPQYDEVREFINTNPTNGSPIPDEWNLDCLTELRARGLVYGKNRKFSVTPINYLDRIAEFHNKELIIAAWSSEPSNVHGVPVIHLENRNACHWNNLAQPFQVISPYSSKPITKRKLPPVITENMTGKTSRLHTSKSLFSKSSFFSNAPTVKDNSQILQEFTPKSSTHITNFLYDHKYEPNLVASVLEKAFSSNQIIQLFPRPSYLTNLLQSIFIMERELITAPAREQLLEVCINLLLDRKEEYFSQFTREEFEGTHLQNLFPKHFDSLFADRNFLHRSILHS